MRRNSTISNSHDIATDSSALRKHYHRISTFRGVRLGGQIATGLGALGIVGSSVTYVAQNIMAKHTYGDFSSVPYVVASAVEVVGGLAIAGLAHNQSRGPRFISRADPLYQTDEARRGAGVMFSLLTSTAVAAAAGIGVNHVIPEPLRKPTPVEYSVGQVRAPKLPTLVARPA